ncbi:hypothetical protein DSL72_002489 [Monilinia vaccinii-corymbosi]|uniref:Uncharacterized protein n=1 Tax=Monilinia vaccinii-corymbosi TaxID=61207 RepID=A0A8A3PCU2_9HELO|nr:hypothetical protein DSL72_002489 [Monilinia vaccinii-corymbosi]
MNPSQSRCQSCLSLDNCQCRSTASNEPRGGIAQNHPRAFQESFSRAGVYEPPAAIHRGGCHSVNPQDIRLQAPQPSQFRPNSSPSCPLANPSFANPNEAPTAGSSRVLQPAASQDPIFSSRGTQFWEPRPISYHLYGAPAWTYRLATFTRSLSINTTTRSPESARAPPREQAASGDPRRGPEGEQEAGRYEKRSKTS